MSARDPSASSVLRAYLRLTRSYYYIRHIHLILGALRWREFHGSATLLSHELCIYEYGASRQTSLGALGILAAF